ncbi:cation/H(+) antiporter 3-like [Lotus japonicus]|uniref:cation/H(+) antiporter 3-like n=1 Tax=Lotus japonicus TaxID=34305 RepID=UPI00258A71E8|nr:cation/H(+) antiporter 3-like [Lotus japonicus]
MEFNADKTLLDLVTQFNETLYQLCFAAPPKTVSDGIWSNQKKGRTPMKSFFPVFELQVLVIFVITQICRTLIKPLRLPLFISQMMAGLILVGSFELAPLESYMTTLFPFGTHDIISTISSIGLVLFIFINGVQMDFNMIKRTGHKAWVISTIGLIAPLLLGLAPLAFFPGKLEKEHEMDIYVSLVSHSLTSFAVVASLLTELKIQNSELGRLALSSALVSDILSIIVAMIAVVVVKTPNGSVMARELFLSFSLVVLIPLIFRPVMFWIIKNTPEGRPVNEGYIYMIIAMVFVMGVFSVKINHEFISGAFILGLSVPEGPPLGSALVKKLKFFGNTFLLPIFVTTAMLRADLKMDYLSTTNLVIGLVVFVTHVVKIISCFIPALFCQMPVNDALTVALIMNTKGIVEVGLFFALHDNGLIGNKTYALMMISVMVIATIVQLSVKFLYDPSRKYAGYQKRNIISLKPNSELRILVTIHKPNHISTSINFLDVCHPTTEHPIIVDALHLIELVGRSLPIFTSHGLQRQSSSTGSHRSYSDNVILAFDIFQHDNPNATSVSTYTAISPPSLMYENVCTLALDKLASMILLPFHQRWSSDGKIESDDKNLRALNCKVLETAPCTVGILVCRASHLRKDSCTKLAMIYLGGTDDQEALCLAKRAIVNPNISMVVYHLVVKHHVAELEDLMVMEEDVLQEVKHAHNVVYKEVFVKDGSDTTSFLRDIVNEHEFFIVGRRHEINAPQTMGLTDWSEFSELGVIADVLSSSDFKSDASILVVQQQLSHKKSTKGLIF